MIDVTTIFDLHADSIIQWKAHGVSFNQAGFLLLAQENHAFNYQLWHAEDRARRDDKGFEFIALAKREIDTCNQARNNRMESMDNWLFEQLKPADFHAAPVHSETPGMMIDRLSILSLKAYHMEEQTQRTDVDATHITTCLQKLATIQAQQTQLLSCLQSLIEEVIHHKRTFRLYRQFKMYNDPNLNPELYNK